MSKTGVWMIYFLNVYKRVLIPVKMGRYSDSDDEYRRSKKKKKRSSRYF